MYAVLGKQVSNGKNLSHEKEVVNTFSAIGYKKGGMKELITIRCYMGRSSSASKVYATIWVKSDGYYTSGHGSAGGCGYDKISAAIDDAIISANIELRGKVYDSKSKSRRKTSINGIGTSAIREAMQAIARKLGYKKIFISEH